MLDSETPGSIDPDIAALTADELADFAPNAGADDDEVEEQPVPAGSPSDPTAALTDSTPPAPVPSAAQAAPASATAPVPPVGTATTPAVPAPESPFQIKVDGHVLPIQGSQLPDGRIAFTPEQWGNLREKYVANRERWVEKERGFREQIQQARGAVKQLGEAKTERDAQSDFLVNTLEQIMDLPDKAGDQPGTARVVAFLDLCEKYPHLKAERTTQYWKDQATQAGQRVAPIDAAARWKAEEPEFRENFQASLEDYLGRPEFAVLKPQQAALFTELWRMGMEEGAIGLTPDGYRFDTRTFERHLKAEAGFAKRLEDEKQKLAIGKRNDAALKPGQQPAPSVPVNGAVVVTTNGGYTAPKTREEYRERLRQMQEDPNI